MNVFILKCASATIFTFAEDWRRSFFQSTTAHSISFHRTHSHFPIVVKSFHRWTYKHARVKSISTLCLKKHAVLYRDTLRTNIHCLFDDLAKSFNFLFLSSIWIAMQNEEEYKKTRNVQCIVICDSGKKMIAYCLKERFAYCFNYAVVSSKRIASNIS